MVRCARAGALAIALWTGLAVAAGAAEQRIEIPSLASARAAGAPAVLDAALFRPDGRGPFPAIVALHGCAGLMQRSGALDGRFADWGARLAGLGYVVLFPESFTPSGVREICTRADRDVGPTRGRPEDAYAALAWLAAQPDVRADAIGVIGWSNGGSTVLSVIDAARALPPDAGATFRAAAALYPGCRTALRARAWAARVPLAIFIGGADDWTPAAPCSELAAAARRRGQNVEITLYPGAHHDFDHPGMRLHLRRGLAFTANGAGTAMLGTDPAARADVLLRLPAFLAATLGR